MKSIVVAALLMMMDLNDADGGYSVSWDLSLKGKELI